MNLQENISRIKSVMGLNEQVQPKAPVKTVAKPATAPQSNNNEQIFIEALSYGAKNNLVYVSQVKPGFIGVIMNMRGESKITTKAESYGAYTATHEMDVRFYQVTKVPTSREDIVSFDLIAKNANGEFSNEELSFATAFQQFNQKTLTIGRSTVSSYPSQGPGLLLTSLMRMKLSMEQAINLMKTVVPDIGSAIMTDLTQLEYNGVSVEEKNKYRALIAQMTPFVNGGQQVQQNQAKP